MVPWFSTLKNRKLCDCSQRQVWCLRFGIVPPADAYWEELRALALASGLHSVAVTSAEPLLRAREHIEDRVGRGLVNGMQFTFRNPVRSTTPTMSVDGAKSIIVAARSYDVREVNHGDGLLRYPARVARYVWHDHNAELKKSLEIVKKRLKSDGHRAVVFADDNSVVDREVAWRSGLGWFGKNANILLPGAGSYFVLGCIVTTAELPNGTPLDDGCGPCARCLSSCPTDAIVAPGVIDANRCLSWLLQKPGVFPRDHRVALADRIYGCDECQSTCPPTQRSSVAGEVPVDITSRHRRHIDVVWMLAATDEELLEACDPWYIHERNPLWLRRNALIILGNIGDADDAEVRRVLEASLLSTEPVLRAHAVWACARLGLTHLLSGVEADVDDMVRAEFAHLPTCRDDL
jgi:epoxyqueuosine reductase